MHQTTGIHKENTPQVLRQKEENDSQQGNRKYVEASRLVQSGDLIPALCTKKREAGGSEVI